MSSRLNKKGNIKLPIGRLAKNIQSILPLIEEVTDAGLIPLCLIGFTTDKNGEKVYARFATLTDDAETKAVLIKCCKELIEAEGKELQK